MQQSSWRPVFYASAVERSAFCYSTILTVSYPASWLTIKLSATKCKQHICYCWRLLSSCSQSVTTSGQLENCPRLWIKDRPTALPSMLTLTHDLDFLSMASCIYDPYTCRNQGGQVFQKECKQMSRGDFITVLTNVIGNYWQLLFVVIEFRFM